MTKKGYLTTPDAHMESKTLDALKGSIAKWESIVSGAGEDKGWENCPLCIEFNNPDKDEQGCVGCPVADAGHYYCDDTPYYDWFNTFATRNRKIASTPERKTLAQAELDFLRSLLPADATALTSAERTP